MPGQERAHQTIDILNPAGWRVGVAQQTLQPEQAAVLNFYQHAVRHAEQIVLHPEGWERRGLQAMKELFAAGMRRCIGAIDFSAATADDFLGVRTAELMTNEWRTEGALVLLHQ